MGGIDGLGDRARFLGTTIVTGIYVMLGGMVLFASIVGILDLIGRRGGRREQKQ